MKNIIDIIDIIDIINIFIDIIVLFCQIFKSTPKNLIWTFQPICGKNHVSISANLQFGWKILADLQIGWLNQSICGMTQIGWLYPAKLQIG